MALKDIFTMIKADRYTADGCEVLNKAREADVEDRRYNIGEISEKTGLQKTANGWVKPKKGGKITPKGKDLMERASKNPNLTEHGRAAASKLAKEYNEKLNGSSESAKKDASGAAKMTPEQKSKWEAKAANSSETKASLRNFISSLSKPEAKANPHADEIIEIYKNELAKREKNPGYRPEKVYSDKPSESNPYEMTEAEKKESMKDPGTRLSQKYDAVLKTKKGTPEHDKAMSEYLAERDSYKESQGAEAAKKFPVDPLQGTESKTSKNKPSSAERPSHEKAYLDAFKDEKLKSDVKAAIKKYGATGNNLRNALYKNDKELSDKLEKMQPDFANQFIAEMQRESKTTDSAPRVLTGDCKVRIRKA